MYTHTRKVDDKLPATWYTGEWGIGANVQLSALDKKRVDDFHLKRQIVAIWNSGKIFQEGPEFWREVSKVGTDILFTDYPVEAIKWQKVYAEELEREKAFEKRHFPPNWKEQQKKVKYEPNIVIEA